MFHLILTACLVMNSGECRPLLLPQGDAPTKAACDAAAQRISESWIAKHPDLRTGGVECLPNADLPAVELTEIASGIWLRQGIVAQIKPENRGRIANLSVVVGTDSVAVTDAGASRIEAAEFYTAIRRLTDKPISHLVLTHMHPDHVLGASVFVEAGAQVVGNSKLALALEARAQTYQDNFNRLLGPSEMIGTTVISPDNIVANQRQIGLGDRVLSIEEVPTAHTDNDLILHDTATGTLFTGDLVFRGLTPVVDGSINGWLNWLESPPESPGLIVPGHGEVARTWQEAVAKQQDLLVILRDSVRSSIASGQPMSAAVPEIVSQLQRFQDGWIEFDETIARDATAAYKELEWE